MLLQSRIEEGFAITNMIEVLDSDVVACRLLNAVTCLVHVLARQLLRVESPR